MNKLYLSAKTFLLISAFLLLIVFPLFADTSDFLWAYARWNSLHSGYYDALQTGKEISWDEQYEAEFGIRELHWKDATFSMDLNSRQFFDDNVVYLKNVSLCVKKVDWNFTARSIEHGYGTYLFNNNPVLHKGFAKYSYQPMRLNSLQLAYQDFSIDIGGNKHNQATAILGWEKATPGLIKHVLFRQEVRAMDSHWRTPVAISALTFKLSNKNDSTLYVRHQDFPSEPNWWVFYSTLAASYLPEMDSTRESRELFGHLVFLYNLLPCTKFRVEGAYTKKDYAPKEIQQYMVQVEKGFRDITVIPLTEYSIIDGEDFWSHRLNLKYAVKHDCDIGLYYENSYFQAENPRHTFGLALDFGLEFPLITSELQNP